MRAILPDNSLLSVEEALSKFVQEMPPKREIIEVKIDNALGLVAAEDIWSNIDLPPFSRSTVDGFAVKSSDTPGSFKIIGKIGIGEAKELRIEKGVAVEVDTGSILPYGADAVVKIEDTRVNNNIFFIDKKIPFGLNVAWVGSDINRNSIIVREGNKITPEIISLLASTGISEIKVFRPPKIYIVSTGNELISSGEELSIGKIFESNSYYLSAVLRKDGFIPVGREVVKDSKIEIWDAINRGLEKADVVLITGGTSAGEKDYVHQIIREKGKIVVHGLRIKPGKPAILGIIEGKPVFGIPGNAVATIMIYGKLIRNYLSQMVGERTYEEESTIARLLLPVKADSKRFTYIPVFLVDGYAIPVRFESYMIGTFTLADGYIALNPGEEKAEDEEVKVILNSKEKDPVILGEEDPRLMNLPFRKILLGSYPACKALEKGIGDILVISSFTCNPEKYNFSISRKIVSNGTGDEIGYDDWIGISKIVKNPSVKLKSPSTAPYFLGRAKVIAPEGYITGEEINTETLYIIVKKGKEKFLEGIFR
ncbi:molybdopterin biosynthesis protein MoeA [Candidatus Acidianus copahuensis]|uniref:Molybdopterin biosynthesis protein MoeA n=1 Tax=Candidatus Acidianus copahuensis TaxID=1160895 RepID=A0A031LTG3_9CREN|nr:molybdopterin-binding protein [Candidatus Acidianus copahuensis]EZQ10794.1 molybdopterin biosynthesis protein MoeA [Candidatus Acidianus copahuensis]